MSAKRGVKNKLLRALLISYIAILCIACALICRYDYINKRDGYLAEMNKTLIYLMAEYKNVTDGFWQYYLPIFSDDTADAAALNRYFERDAELSPIDKRQIMSVMQRMTIRAESLRWIALVSPNRQSNYIYYAGMGRLEELAADFPFLYATRASDAHMRVLGGRAVTNAERASENNFAIMGGAPAPGAQGKLLFGFHAQTFDKAIADFNGAFKTLNFMIVEDGEVIYSSAGARGAIIADSRAHAVAESPEGKRVLIRPLEDAPRRSICYYTLEWGELFRASCEGIALAALWMFLLIVLTIALFLLMLALVNREVSSIRAGLARIGDNHLDYRLSTNYRNEGFNDIAFAINEMTETLERTVEKSYAFELKRREHELAELMAKFNPHFLYNTLDLFRSRCMKNGDMDTAELIAHVATIFRGLISARNVITIREELAFSEHYLKLFRARYGERMRVMYDFDSDILDCMIIRNIFQPLIENYFEHGFDGARANNYLRMRGEKAGDKALKLTVDDNGAGMNDESLKKLRERLEAPETREGESYGLKNLHQRVRLYYGEGYGLTVALNDEGGMSVEILVARTPTP